MSLVQEGAAKPEDFRFFFKYAAWAPGQLEAEMESGCWCAVRSSLDLVLKPRSYPGLHFAKAHKVFWHQVLQVRWHEAFTVMVPVVVRTTTYG